MRRLASVIVFGLLGCSNGSSAEPTSAKVTAPFTSAGEMTANRSGLSAIELPTGIVLVTGGSDLASSETWDPVAATWATAKAMGSARKGHTSTIVGSTGKVAVFGGHATATGEIYDPASDAWADVADDGGRTGHTATQVGSGQLLIVGGSSSSGLLGARLYDPDGNTWAAAGTMKTPREGHAMERLSDGRVVVFGGRTDSATALSGVEIYDAGDWAEAGALAEARSELASLVMSDGKVFLAGGNGGAPSATVEIWDPATSTATKVASMAEARAGARAVMLGTGRILVIGGATASGATRSTEVFDPSAGTWVSGPSLSVARREFSVISSSGGRILIVGGNDGASDLKSTEVFGGVAPGGACAIDEECVEGKCSGGKCAATSDDPATPVDPESPPTVEGSFAECKTGTDCPSGFCVEGVCCDKACDGKCESCSLPTSPGKCTLQPYGTDKKKACGGGGCVGTCDGKGECMGAGAGTQCLPVRCIGPAKGAGPAICTAKGAPCPESASITFDCTPYACEAALGACRSTCGSTANCAPGFICDATSRVCVAPAGDDESDGCAYGAGRSTASAFLFALGALGAVARRRKSR